MNRLEQLEKNLIAAAKNAAPDDRVPYAFEKRIMALLHSRVVDPISWWARGLWRAAASCAMIALMCAAWTFFNPVSTAAPVTDISQNFETTLLASIDTGDQPQ